MISKSNERAAQGPKLHDTRFNYHFITSILPKLVHGFKKLTCIEDIAVLIQCHTQHYYLTGLAETFVLIILELPQEVDAVAVLIAAPFCPTPTNEDTPRMREFLPKYTPLRKLKSLN